MTTSVWPTCRTRTSPNNDVQLTQLVVVQNKSRLSVVAVLPTSHLATTLGAILAAMQQETIAARSVTRTGFDNPQSCWSSCVGNNSPPLHRDWKGRHMPRWHHGAPASRDGGHQRDPKWPFRAVSRDSERRLWIVSRCSRVVYVIGCAGPAILDPCCWQRPRLGAQS